MQTTWKPAPGQVALIEPDDGASLTGIVVGGSGGPVVVDLGTGATLAAHSPVTASFFAPDALYRMRATAEPHGTHRAVVDLNVLGVERVQRRAVPRARVTLDATLSDFDDGGSGFVSIKGRTVDVGAGGCRVRTRSPFPPGADPTVTLHLPDGTTVSILAAVVASTHDGTEFEYRLVFIHGSDEDIARLSDLATSA